MGKPDPHSKIKVCFTEVRQFKKFCEVEMAGEFLTEMKALGACEDVINKLRTDKTAHWTDEDDRQSYWYAVEIIEEK